MKSPQLLSSSLLLASALLFASCGGGGALVSSGSSSGGSNAGSGSSGNGNGNGGVSFAMADLDGDWTGELIPGTANQLERNIYLRLAEGLVNDSAEGAGGMWSEADANVTLNFSDDGFLSLQMSSTGTGGQLSLEGTMDLAMTKINGTFSLQPDQGSVFSGTFEVRRSSGPDQFTIGLLSGAWEGKGLNPQDKFRLADLDIDEFGVLLSAEMRHPVTDALVHTYSAGAATFSYFDSAVGRLNNVVLAANDGSTLSFDFLLVNDQGTLMGGPGTDSTLGSGHAELIR